MILRRRDGASRVESKNWRNDGRRKDHRDLGCFPYLSAQRGWFLLRTYVRTYRVATVATSMRDVKASDFRSEQSVLDPFACHRIIDMRCLQIMSFPPSCLICQKWISTLTCAVGAAAMEALRLISTRTAAPLPSAKWHNPNSNRNSPTRRYPSQTPTYWILKKK